MATIEYFVNKKTPASSIPGKVISTNAIIDFSTRNVSSGDIVQVLPISSGSYAISVGVRVLTQEGSAVTVKVGDGSDDDRYGASVNLNTATESSSSQPHYYETDDTIDLVASAAIANAKIEVFALVFSTSVE